MKKKELKIDLDFQTVKVPPVRDILVIGLKLPQGKVGVMESIKFTAPDEFVMININSNSKAGADISAIIVNKGILKRISEDSLIEILEKNVFPYMSPDEAVSVDINITSKVSGIIIENGFM